MVIRRKVNNPLNRSVLCRLSQDEHELFGEKVSQSRLTFSNYLRNIILENLGKEPKISKDKDIPNPNFETIYFVLNQAVISLNLIVDKLNDFSTLGTLSDEKFDSLHKSLDSLELLLKDQLEGLDR